MAAQTLYGAWLELAGAGIGTSVVSLFVLRGLCSYDAWRAARDTAGKERSALLAATCTAPDACWAHVVRAMLRQQGAGAPYRDKGATKSLLPEVVAQRRRIAWTAGLALVGTAALAAFAVAANDTEGFGSAAAVAAAGAFGSVLLAVRLTRSALTSLREVAGSLGDVAGASRPLVPGRSRPHGPDPIASVGGGGCVLVMFALPGAALLLALLASTTVRLDAAHAQGPTVGMAFTAALLVAATAVARRVSIRIHEGRELIVENRGFVFPANRRVVPIEIVRGIRVEERRAARGGVWDLVADLEPAGRTTLLTWSDEGDAGRLQAAISEALGEWSSIAA